MANPKEAALVFVTSNHRLHLLKALQPTQSRPVIAPARARLRPGRSSASQHLPHEGNAAESDEQDSEREFGDVRHLLVAFLPLILGFGEVTLGAPATEHGHPLRGARLAGSPGLQVRDLGLQRVRCACGRRGSSWSSRPAFAAVRPKRPHPVASPVMNRLRRIPAMIPDEIGVK